MIKLKIGMTKIELERLKKGKKLEFIVYSDDEKKVEIEMKGI